METKKTLILGASPNPERYAFKAAQLLHQKGVPFVPMGIKKGEILGQPIVQERLPLADIHTITLYIGAAHQPEWYEYLLSLKPQRIVFNPNTENEAFAKLAQTQGIETLEACTLVMLSTGQF